MFRTIAIASIVFGIVGAVAGDAQAQWRERSGSRDRRGGVPQPVSLRLELTGDFFLHGDVSEDATDPPSYAKAFGAGFGALVEFDYRAIPALSVHVRTGYLHHVGGHDGPIDFDPWSLVPVLVGCKLYPPIGGAGVDLFARLELGAGLSQAADIEIDVPPLGSVSSDFYESSTLFLFGVGIGLAYSPPGSSVLIIVEIGYRGFTGPDIDSTPADEGEMGGAIQIGFGIGIALG
jgi:hypothetical protein